MLYNTLFEELEETLVLDESDVEGSEPAHLIVYNDDHNTFDWVIESLIKVCRHTAEQAEQLSLLIHFKGKATIKTAPFRVVKPMKDALVDRGLSAVVEE
jgi:ATP-dependent Clp protease adaptor protein ClpS